MDSKTYSQLAMRTANDLGHLGNLIHGSMLVASETGEIVDVFKKHFAYGRDLDLVALTEEAGDLMWGANLMCDSLNMQFSELIDAAKDFQAVCDEGNDGNRHVGMLALALFSASGTVTQNALDVVVASTVEDNYDEFSRSADKTLQALCETVGLMLSVVGDQGLSIEQIFEANIAKIEKRYPDLKFNQGHASNRDKAAELSAVEAIIK